MCVCCEGQVVSDVWICKEWKCISKVQPQWREGEFARAELLILLEEHSGWRKVSAGLEGGVVLAEDKSGYPGCGKRTWIGFGVWFYFPLHKIILIHWWREGMLPELTVVFSVGDFVSCKVPW